MEIADDLHSDRLKMVFYVYIGTNEMNKIGFEVSDPSTGLLSYTVVSFGMGIIYINKAFYVGKYN